jgi:hypothetical protein
VVADPDTLGHGGASADHGGPAEPGSRRDQDVWRYAAVTVTVRRRGRRSNRPTRGDHCWGFGTPRQPVCPRRHSAGHRAGSLSARGPRRNRRSRGPRPRLRRRREGEDRRIGSPRYRSA